MVAITGRTDNKQEGAFELSGLIKCDECGVEEELELIFWYKEAFSARKLIDSVNDYINMSDNFRYQIFTLDDIIVCQECIDKCLSKRNEIKNKIALLGS